ARASDDALVEFSDALAREISASPSAALDNGAVARITSLYGDLGESSRARHHLLRLLAAAGERRALEAFAALMAADPPRRAGRARLCAAFSAAECGCRRHVSASLGLPRKPGDGRPGDRPGELPRARPFRRDPPWSAARRAVGRALGRARQSAGSPSGTPRRIR